MVAIVCRCKRLVDVVDNKIAEHADCEMSGARYVPQRGRMPSQPRLELGIFEGPCGQCGEPGIAVAVRQTGGGPSFGTSNN